MRNLNHEESPSWVEGVNLYGNPYGLEELKPMSPFAKKAIEHMMASHMADCIHAVQCECSDKTIIENLETGRREVFCAGCGVKILEAWPIANNQTGEIEKKESDQ